MASSDVFYNLLMQFYYLFLADLVRSQKCANILLSISGRPCEITEVC